MITSHLIEVVNKELLLSNKNGSYDSYPYKVCISSCENEKEKRSEGIKISFLL